MSAREIIHRELVSLIRKDKAKQPWPDAILSALTSSGYRILGPDELDAVTVEECAEHLEGWGDMYGDNAANAIRALSRATHQGDK